jgi:hypothetical protein
MKISINRLRQLIKEELMAVNARSGATFPIMGTNVPKPVMDKAKQIIFDFDKDDEFFELLSQLEPSDKKAAQEPAATASKQKTSLIPALPKIPARLPVPPQPEPKGRRR